MQEFKEGKKIDSNDVKVDDLDDLFDNLKVQKQ